MTESGEATEVEIEIDIDQDPPLPPSSDGTGSTTNTSSNDELRDSVRLLPKPVTKSANSMYQQLVQFPKDCLVGQEE